MRITGIIILIAILTSCNSKSDKLFWIEKNTKHRNDFLFMAESTNVLPISADSVRKFLDWEEIEKTKLLESQIYKNDTILPHPVIFKNFGEIYKSDKFKLFVIFRDSNDTLCRDYKFILRTYTNDWKIIDSYDLAIWNEKRKEYCFGSINKNLIIERRCNDSEYPDIMQITKNGRIIMTSFHKP
jgi:hypothetical protein